MIENKSVTFFYFIWCMTITESAGPDFLDYAGLDLAFSPPIGKIQILDRLSPTFGALGKKIGGLIDNVLGRGDDVPNGARSTGGLRAPASQVLDDAQISQITREFVEVGGDPAILRFNRGSGTSYVDELDIINVKGNVFPLEGATHPRSSMSSKAVLAHELGHREYRGTRVEFGAWNDEFRASYWAAKNAPNLSELERADLVRDAISRAQEANVAIRQNRFMKQTLYGY